LVFTAIAKLLHRLNFQFLILNSNPLIDETKVWSDLISCKHLRTNVGEKCPKLGKFCPKKKKDTSVFWTKGRHGEAFSKSFDVKSTNN
jgi:hypothetical protein